VRQPRNDGWRPTVAGRLEVIAADGHSPAQTLMQTPETRLSTPLACHGRDEAREPYLRSCLRLEKLNDRKVGLLLLLASILMPPAPEQTGRTGVTNFTKNFGLGKAAFVPLKQCLHTEVNPHLV
jgi:hypothetical protein